jgi:predicted phosphohydrolase
MRHTDRRIPGAISKQLWVATAPGMLDWVGSMRLVFVSDTHTHRNINLPEGDVLVHAGDATSTGTLPQVSQFLEWFSSQPHRHKIFIAGNHDWLFHRVSDL